MKLTPEQIELWISKNFKYKRRKDGDELLISNPDGDTKFRLHISTVYKPLKKKHNTDGSLIYGHWVNDYRPNHQQYNGSFVNFVKKYRGISYFEALKEITGTNAKTLRDQLHHVRISDKPDEVVEDKSDDIALPNSYSFKDNKEHKLREIALSYIKNRAIKEETIINHQLHYTGSTVVFPYMEYGSLVYWQERNIIEKVFNFPDEKVTGLKKTDYLYNFDNVEQPCEYVIVVESIFNCLSVGDNCVATGGSTIVDGSMQLRKLIALRPSIVILAPDNDDAGRKSLKHNYFILRSHFPSIAYCLPPTEADWNNIDQIDGVGAARRYIENNTKRLSIVTLGRFANC